ncbi:MAG: chromate transporter [Burkholderiaceae bacterium]
MSWNLNIADWLALSWHFLSLSLLTVGSGSLTTAPQMHNYLVDERHWLTNVQFNTSITIAQAAPGPNMLYIALLGWNVGMATHSWTGSIVAMTTAMVGSLLPSTIVTLAGTRWGHRNRNRRSVRAFKAGLAPITTALLIATGWLLMRPYNQPGRDWPLWIATAVTVVLVWRTNIHLLWLLAAGALLGILGIA